MGGLAYSLTKPKMLNWWICSMEGCDKEWAVFKIIFNWKLYYAILYYVIFNISLLIHI